MTPGYILTIFAGRQDDFEHYVSVFDKFAEPVKTFAYNRNYPYLVFISAAKNQITHLGSGTGGQAAGSGMRRLNISSIIRLATPVSLNDLLKLSSHAVKTTIKKLFVTGGVLPSKPLQK